MKPKKNTNNGNLRPPGKMFGGGGRNGGQKYSHIRAYSDSDGSSSDDEYGGGNPNDDFIQREIRQQKVRCFIFLDDDYVEAYVRFANKTFPLRTLPPIHKHTADDEETGRGARNAWPVGGAIESDIDGDTR